MEKQKVIYGKLEWVNENKDSVKFTETNESDYECAILPNTKYKGEMVTFTAFSSFGAEEGSPREFVQKNKVRFDENCNVINK